MVCCRQTSCVHTYHSAVLKHATSSKPSSRRSSKPTSTTRALVSLCATHSLLLFSGVPIKAPIVDGLSGTVFAMEATIQALVDNLPPERRANPTVAILGGGGYIGARLVNVLATKPPGASTGGVAPQARRSTGKAGSLLEPQSSFSLEVEPETAASGFKSSLASVMTPSVRTVGMSATVTLRDREPTLFRQIIALDTRYADKRFTRSGVLHTAEARDLETADVVLVITRNGDDVDEYVRHAQPGQVRYCCADILVRLGCECYRWPAGWPAGGWQTVLTLRTRQCCALTLVFCGYKAP